MLRCRPEVRPGQFAMSDFEHVKRMMQHNKHVWTMYSAGIHNVAFGEAGHEAGQTRVIATDGAHYPRPLTVTAAIKLSA